MSPAVIDPLTVVEPPPRPPALFGRVDPALAARLESLQSRAHGMPRVWHVNSTAEGGGVAEMLPSLVGCARGAGVDMRWLVVHGSEPFFRVTKRLHHALHGARGDGSPLDEEARAVYEAALAPAAAALLDRIGRGDAVMLHDPQTAGLAGALAAAGHPVVWRSHVGHDDRNAEVERAWRFLRPYIAPADGWVFSRAAYVPPGLERARTAVVAPSVDPTTAKNEELDATQVRAILERAGVLAGSRSRPRPVRFSGADGTPRVVARHARVLAAGGPPAPDVPLVVQISRWDPLKDFSGVMAGFAELLAAPGALPPAQLVLAGPAVDGVADDPEAAATFEAVARNWAVLPADTRARVCLVQFPMDDVAENASIVNALQRHATVVVQKSLHEGFGLTVTEAMLKGRPVIASAVGGLRDQVEDGVTGVLLDDPRASGTFARRLGALLRDPGGAAALGRAARRSVLDRFLTPRHLDDYAEVVRRASAHAAQRPERAFRAVTAGRPFVVPA